MDERSPTRVAAVVPLLDIRRLRSRFRFLSAWRLVSPVVIALVLASGVGGAIQVPAGETPAEAETATPESPARVDIEPLAEDDEIAARLTRILEATEWYEQPSVEVDEGVVFLGGATDTEAHKEWAGKLASNTQDVVAVVNRIQVTPPSMWDLSPAWEQMRLLAEEAVRSTPLLLLGLVLLIVAWFTALWSARLARLVFRRHLKNELLRYVAARAVAVPVFLVGLYLVLKVSGLTRLAVTVLGGTGLLGLAVGFAFRDVAENFLASVVISVQNPFRTGDLIKVGESHGFVQHVNTRATVLMTLEGNHVQIPNSTVFKETIINYTANPNIRFDLLVGIGYEDSTAGAQSIALRVLQDHPAVVDDPEPLVLVETLGASTVNLRVYFWVDIQRFSALKVKSAVARQIKLAFQEADISMPDEAREVVFPAGVPVRQISESPDAAPVERTPAPDADSDRTASTQAEGDLASEAIEIRQQARRSRLPESGENLLEAE